ncbi:isoleucine--tRNA ligase [bacterium]|nr:isoleucine--tRNA ligase [bacterium]
MSSDHKKTFEETQDQQGDDPSISFPKIEREILEFWNRNQIFQKSMEKKAQQQSYVFYDGPPFATGLPHYGHLLAGTIKDVVGRFFTMKGFHVDRRLGWDCHGVPVEFEIQKMLNLHGAKAIKEFGIGKFNEECRKIVLRYTNEWRAFIERSGRWVDFSRPYHTMDRDFMESIWAIFRKLWDQGLIYEGLKCVPYSWAINTPLSNFEANLNYKDVQDPAVTVRAEFIGELPEFLQKILPQDYRLTTYAWTTTPWTLPSNLALAFGPGVQYCAVKNESLKEVVIIAENRAEVYFPELKKSENQSTILASFTGDKVIGISYRQFFPYFETVRSKGAFKTYSGEFVTDSDGTGIVHCASFGEDDLKLFLANSIPVVDPVDEEGNFTAAVVDFAGLNIKAADAKIIHSLKEQGKLVRHETIQHSYPFCWRTDTPLIYKSISSWFVKVEALREKLLKNNAQIHWVPEHIRDGRFGKWLEGARDWAISRNRYWGTPLPIWRCAETGEMLCIGSVAELEKLSGKKVNDLHSQHLDEITFTAPSGKGLMQRVPEVLDCWFESGSMPYGQEHYPFENRERFEANFPADFIAEGLDQTRGWFYTLLVLSTALFDKPAFKNVIVNGIILAEDGKKMSKSLKNYPPPEEVMEEFGADAMRLYLLSSAATRGEDLRFSKQGVKQVVRQTILPLWNAYNFYATYAAADNWQPAQTPQLASENLLDRWILSKFASLVQGVDRALSSYHLSAAVQPILDFVDQLTNWYIRLNRRRFWSEGKATEEDKTQAYATLHTVLTGFVRVLAPLAPFIAEEIYQRLTKANQINSAQSVHLACFPTLDVELSKIDLKLESGMSLFEEVILLGRSLRNDLGIKVRQPLKSLLVIHPSAQAIAELKPLEIYIREELNVKAVSYSTDESQYVDLSANLNTVLLGKTLGPKLGSKGMQELRSGCQNLTSEQIRSVESGGKLALAGVELGQAELVIKRKARAGVTGLGSSGQISILLDTELSPALLREGLAREFVNRVQKVRKDSNFNVSDRIRINYTTAFPDLTASLSDHAEYIKAETLAVELSAQQLQPSWNELEIEGHPIHVLVERI